MRYGSKGYTHIQDIGTLTSAQFDLAQSSLITMNLAEVQRMCVQLKIINSHTKQVVTNSTSYCIHYHSLNSKLYHKKYNRIEMLAPAGNNYLLQVVAFRFQKSLFHNPYIYVENITVQGNYELFISVWTASIRFIPCLKCASEGSTTLVTGKRALWNWLNIMVQIEILMRFY